MIRVAYVSPEVRPFAKTGGLADVADALPAALAARGIQTRVFVPCYRSATRWLAAHAPSVEEVSLPDGLWIGGVQHPVVYRCFQHELRQVVLVVNDALYDREELYGTSGSDYRDNVARFAFFCRAVLEYGLFTGEVFDVLHANDWESALAVVYLQTLYRRPHFASTRSLLTVHNLGYQGMFSASELAVTGLGWDLFHPEGLEFYGQLNLLKGGIVFADAVNTVSPTYAEEIQTEQQGWGLHGVLRARRGKLSGILNGIDVQEWNPATDPYLRSHYSDRRLSGKAACKRALQRRLGLPLRPQCLLLGVISRFVAQKGIHLVADAFPALGGVDLQLAVLGSGDRNVEQQMEGLMAAHRDRVAIVLGFDDELAHLIEAGADAFLMPSAYEPCGLNQMYSQRYGTVPIVRETGGLTDTVTDYTPERLAAGTASGFTFGPFDAAHLADAIRRTADVYQGAPRRWKALVRHIMQLDHSWESSARAYEALYRNLLASKAR